MAAASQKLVQPSPRIQARNAASAAIVTVSAKRPSQRAVAICTAAKCDRRKASPPNMPARTPKARPPARAMIHAVRRVATAVGR
jgi:hypothetical protein